MRKLLVTYTFLNEERLQKIKDAAVGFEVITSDVNSDISDAEIVFGMLSKDVSLSSSKKLKWVHSQNAGIENFLKAENPLPDGVILTNSAGCYGPAISEYMITTALMLLKKMPSYAKEQFNNNWKPLGTVKMFNECNVLSVGLGDIGSLFSIKANALGATVNAVVKNKREAPSYIKELYVIEELDKALSTADIIAISLPGTTETKGLFNYELLKKAKKASYILNVGRGNIIKTEDLIKVLEEGHIEGVALDVTDPEPLPKDSPLWQMRNVLITPHSSNGGNLSITRDLIIDKFVKYLDNYIKGIPFEKTVDKKAGY